MDLKTKYNLGNKMYIVFEPQTKSANFLVKEGIIIGLQITIEKEYKTEKYTIKHTSMKVENWATTKSSLYLEKNKDYNKIFETQEQANTQAEYLRKKLLKYNKEENKINKEYQEKKIKNEIEELKKKAKRLKIKL